MLERLKNLIYKKPLLFLGGVISTIFLYLSLNNLNFYPILVIFLLFLNFYYLRGVEIFLGSILLPAPIFLIKTFYNANIILLLIIWVFYLYLFLHKPKVSWSIFLFSTFLFLNILLNHLSILSIFILLFSILFLIFLFSFRNNLLSSIIKSIFISEIFWLSYFLPFNFYLRSILVFIFYIWILNKDII
ncbi:MAG: hypothetical protein ACP5JU_00895 [Minisyncoccia bacterium]